MEKICKKKSELQGTALSNLRQTYYHNGSAIIENKESNDQFLKNTILFNDFFTGHQWYNDLLVDLGSKDTANIYKGKKWIYMVFIMVINVLGVHHSKQLVCMAV